MNLIMKINKILFYLTAIFHLCFYSACGDDNDVVKTPPVSGTAYFNVSVNPLSYEADGGTFTVTIKADWYGTLNENITIDVYKGSSSGCLSHRFGGIITKNEAKDFPFHTTNLGDWDPGSGCDGYGSYFIEIEEFGKTYTQEITWNSTLSTIDVSMEKGMMEYIFLTETQMNNALTSAQNTFSNSASNTNVTINSHSAENPYPLLDFTTATTDYEIALQLNQFIVQFQEDPKNYPYITVFGNKCRLYPHDPCDAFTGFSMNKNCAVPGFENFDRNFSFVFIQNIADFCQRACTSYPDFIHESVRNMTIAHELVHQFGNVWVHNGHNTPEHCVLNNLAYFRTNTNNFTTLTNFYVICGNHKSSVRNGLNSNNTLSTNLTGGKSNYQLTNPFTPNYSFTSNPIVNISFPKFTYKKFEPINLQFEWINNSTQNDSIWALFSPLGNYLNIEITSEDGTKYNRKVGSGIINVDFGNPLIVGSYDTLKKSISINQYGKVYEDLMNGVYFGFPAYFPSGKYKISVMIDKDYNKIYSTPIQTNTVEFEVVDNDNADKVILELIKKKNYTEALKRFPNNSYEEYLMYYDLLLYLAKFDENRTENKINSDTEVLFKKYKDFFNKYPNSLYNLNDAFITSYLSPNCNDLESINSRKNELMQEYRNTLLEFILYDLTRRNKLQKCY